MKKPLISLVFVLFLVSCGVESSQQSEGISEINVSSETESIMSLSSTQSYFDSDIGTVVSTNNSASVSVGTSQVASNQSASNQNSTSSTTYPWSSEIKQQMLQVVGEEIPYISEFTQSYQYIVKMMTDSITPYINVYVENASNWVASYKSALTNATYIYESEDLDDGVIWFNYYKTISESKLFIRFAYYHNEGKNWFDIYAYLDNGGGGGLEIPDETNYTLAPDLFPKNSYAKGQQALDYEDLKLAYIDVICYNSTLIQFKKGTGRLFNTQAMAPIDKIFLEDANNYTNFKVLAGTSPSSLVEVATYNGVYGLNGATYFEIKSANINVGQIYSIQIVLR